MEYVASTSTKKESEHRRRSNRDSGSNKCSFQTGSRSTETALSEPA